ncbi:TadE/TadG family type IV pilus assembly protein [Actinoallomurus iriomotensis]|uniref:TadE-like domain-containing protein n=1 Tax=Actinoallomurus iriomotensis TaxID=478107 RepID=A0A9W6RYW0_9ACTN|nr:TadE/TadG family type IV pilus assembly protein [Actinoallomurus iriomotensis]GLY85316.1 hypothetical protein Airi02_032450 [Actinoallomurus iriomotensis]
MAADRDRGGVTVEFTAMLPLIIMALLLVWEAFLIGYAADLAGHAANEAAREAAVTTDRDRITQAARERVSGGWADARRLMVSVTADGYARVTVRPPLVFPGVVLPLDLSARSKIVRESTG